MKYYSIIFFLIYSSIAFGQNEANIWYFGHYAGLDFNSGDPVVISNSAMNQHEGCATISSSFGELLFYTNGMDVWNKNHEIMQNGTGLQGNPSSTQSGVIVPMPQNQNLYYIFAVPAEIGNGISYSIVDMSLNGGLGAITTKNQFLVGPSEEKITAVKHSNNQDIWVITHTWNSSNFYSYLITSDGLNTTPIISDIGSFHSGVQGWTHGYLRASPCGDKVAIVVREINSIEVFDFNNATGEITNPITFPPDCVWPYGIEFSPDGSKIYISEYGGISSFHQYDLNAGTIPEIFDSHVVLASPGTNYAGALQLGPNNKIYFTYANSLSGHDHLGIIHNPNEPGLNCNLEIDGLYLGGNNAVWGLPNFIQSYFCTTTDFIYQYDCFLDTTFFFGSFNGNLTSVLWNFDDPESGTNNTSNLQNPTHVFSAPGTYQVKLEANYANGIDSLIKPVIIYPSPELNLGNDTTYCGIDSVILLSATGSNSYLWQDGSTDSVYWANSSGLYWVEVTNEFGCSAIDSVNLDLFPKPDIWLGNDTLICGGDSLLLSVPAGYESYSWSTGNIGTSITVDSPGPYWVSVCNEFDCCTNDTILVAFYPDAIEELELGSDTTFCEGNLLELNAGSGYTFYQWMDESGTATDSVYGVDTTGLYYVYVSNPCSEAWDSVYVEMLEVEDIDLGNDSTICSGEVVYLDATGNFLSYLWQDGSATPFYYASETGLYWVEAIDSNACPARDTLLLEFYQPDAQLGNDTSFCQGESILLQALPSFEQYLWSNGSINNSLVANSAGTYWCMVTDSLGCQGTDSIVLSMNYTPSIQIIGQEEVCIGDTAWLTYSGLYIDSVFWNNGLADSLVLVTQPANFVITAVNDCGNATDSISVNFVQPSPIFLGNDTIIGSQSEITLDAGSGFVEYLWNDGSSLQYLQVNQPGDFWVNVFDGVCYNTDSINIEPVACELFLPIAFSPNGDGSNDFYFANVSDDIVDFSLKICNRWGEVVWKTNNKFEKWDGKRNNSPLAEGTYYYILRYTCGFKKVNLEKKGQLLLVR